MRRWVVKAGMLGLEALALEEVAVPEPGRGEVRIRVHAAGLNARDWFVLRGGHNRFLDRDLVPLADGAGVVDALGEGVDQWNVGDRVTALYLKGWVDGPPHPDMGMGLGSRDEDGLLAEYVVLPAERLVRIPDSLDLTEAAAVLCAGLTAWNALYAANPIHAGSNVLTLGTGGVSIFALLFARAAGASVYCTSSRDEKAAKLRDLGAADVINYARQPNWGEEIFKRTGRGVDKVVETGGTGSLNQSLDAVAFGGELAMMGFKAGAGDALNPIALMTKGANIRGVGVGSAAMYQAMAQAIDTHRIRPVISRVYGFDEAKEAYLHQDSPELFGKTVITIA